MQAGDSLVVAAVQMSSGADLAANLEVAQRWIGEAAAQGAQLVVLPECFSFLGERDTDKLAVTEEFPAASPGDASSQGPVLTTLRALARQYRISIVGGGTPEAVPGDPGRAYNTAIAVGPDGGLLTSYRKIHLFDIDIPGGPTLRESERTAAGDTPVCIDVGPARVGVTICYDLRFPELYRELVLDHGAEVLLVPAAFTSLTGKAHWHVLLRARAIENQCWVVAAAQWGRHNPKRETYGHSMIIDPWGTIVAEKPDGDGLVVATITGDAVAKTRGQMPCGKHAARWKKA